MTSVSSLSACKFTNSLTDSTCFLFPASSSNRLENKIKSFFSASDCASPPSRIFFMYSDFKNRCQNSLSVNSLRFTQLSMNAFLTPGRSAKIRCIFSEVNVARILSLSTEAPSLAPISSASISLFNPVFCVNPKCEAIEDSFFRRASQNSASDIMPWPTVASKSSFKSGFVSNSCLLASCSTLDGIDAFSTSIFVFCSLIAFEMSSLSFSVSNRRTIAPPPPPPPPPELS